MGCCNHGNEHYHRMREIYQLAKERAAFQVWLCSMDLFICYLFIWFFVGCLVSWSVIQSVGLFVSQRVGWWYVCLFVCLVGWLFGWLAGWLVSQSVSQSVVSYTTPSRKDAPRNGDSFIHHHPQYGPDSLADVPLVCSVRYLQSPDRTTIYHTGPANLSGITMTRRSPKLR